MSCRWTSPYGAIRSQHIVSKRATAFGKNDSGGHRHLLFAHDICDDLSAKRGETGNKGTYPNDFVFKGWHPQCRCYVVPIIADDDEFDRMQEAIAEGREPDESENMIREPNSEFRQWWADNKQRVASAQSLPYWVKDNGGRLGLNAESQSQTARKLGTSAPKYGREAKKSAYKALSEHSEVHNYSEAQMENFREIEKETGWKHGAYMTFEEADNGSANMVRDDENCAACVLVHELRLRGFNATANKFDNNPNSISELLSDNTGSAWLTKKGKTPELTLIGGSDSDIISKLEKQTQGVGSRYHLGWDISEKRGHIVTAERTENGLILYDPQRNAYWDIKEIINDMMNGSKIELLRVDRLLVNPKLLNDLAAILK